MFNFNVIEAQISKRLLVFFAHQATEADVDAAKMQLIICSENRTVAAHIYEAGNHVKELELKAIAESFGKEFDHGKVRDVHDYLVKTAKAASIELEKLNIVICATNGKVGAYVYNESKCMHKIPAMELLTLFYFSK